MQDVSNFKNIVAQSVVLRERWLNLTSKIINEIESGYGEVIDREALAELNSVRLATLTGEEFDWRAEATQQFPILKRATEVAKIRAKIEAEDEAAITSEFDGLSPSEAMAKSRALGIGQKVEDRPSLTIDQQADAARKINAMQLSPQERMNQARKSGLKY
ncbi:MAG: hypothetical protein AAFO80_16385 [Pseudomonadota bacterium]